MRRHAALSAGLLSTGALLLCAGCSTATTTGGAAEPATDQAPVVKAAVAATSKGPARMDQKIEISDGGVNAAITVTGDVDFAAHKASLAVDFPQGGISHLDEVLAGKQAYVRGASSGLDDDTWVVVPRDTAVAHYVLRAPLNDPEHVLRQISAMRRVTEAGSEKVAGVPTTRYRGMLDHETLTLRMDPETRKKVDQARDLVGGDLPAYGEAWVDQQGRVVRTRMSMDLGGAHVTVTTGLSALGKPTRVTVPSDDGAVPGSGVTGILTG
ncbi:hypothetical protein [Streptomyces sp. NBC_00083]|uniref:hypothetical protein n=1 Tax=Streptomyces sp. NBC_00083 TaxID=2975647 RepID=UPI00224FB05E|nr:hypothetical protein [Streptomyces sp. NBC_00083]MCX5384812.1 hypothetical protein [Streptomyces sp. NBC_00083]